MDLAFKSRELRAICENQETARREFPAAVAESLQRRLADLRAAVSPHDLIVGKPRVLTIDDREHMAVDLADGYVLAFHPNHPSAPRNGLDWSSVNRIQIVSIERA